jgi:hypothetical protein
MATLHWKARIDGNEPCAICGQLRKNHWGRRNGLAPQQLGHQWRPEPHKYELEHLNDTVRETIAAEQAYQEMLDHPESVVDAQDLF